MNTKNRQDQKKSQRQQTRQEQGPKRRDRNPNMLHGDSAKHHEQEYPEMRMTR